MFLYGFPIISFFPLIENTLRGVQRAVRARKTNVGRACGNGLDDFLFGGSLIQGTANLSFNPTVFAL